MENSLFDQNLGSSGTKPVTRSEICHAKFVLKDMYLLFVIEDACIGL